MTSGTEDGYDIVFTNTIPTTEIVVTKEWKDENTITWPEGVASVTVGLYYDDNGTTKPYPDTDNQKKVTITSSDTGYKKAFTELPVYNTAGAKITYSVKELSITLVDGTTVGTREDGKDYIQIVGLNAQTWSVNETSTSETTWTVTNTPVKTSFDILKVKSDGMTEPLTGAKFRVEKQTGIDATTNEPIYDIAVPEFGDDGQGKYSITGLTDGTYQISR